MKIDNKNQENFTETSPFLSRASVILDENQQLKNENIQLKHTITTLEQQLQKTQSQLNWLQEQVKLATIKKFGKSSETHGVVQLPLFDEVDLPPENVEADEPVETITYQRRKKTVGRLIDTSTLPREIHVHDLPDNEKICSCGHALEEIRRDKSEQLDYVPAKIKVIEHIHPQYACRTCDTVKSAEKPITSPLPKSMASAGLITEIILDKYEYHMPLYRQSQRFKNHGLIIPDNTLG